MTAEGGDVHKTVSGGCVGITDHRYLTQMVQSKEQNHSRAKASSSVIRQH